MKAAKGVNGTKTDERMNLKRTAKMEDICFMDASKEGNVSRFLNVSYRPTVKSRTHNSGNT